MSFFTEPLHIDFVITYQDEKTTTGYWFMTFINGPKDCKVMFKAHDGYWYHTTEARIEEDTFVHYYPIEYAYPSNKAQACSEEQAFMDKLLDNHLSAGGYQDEPYIYWPNSQNTMAF